MYSLMHYDNDKEEDNDDDFEGAKRTKARRNRCRRRHRYGRGAALDSHPSSSSSLLLLPRLVLVVFLLLTSLVPFAAADDEQQQGDVTDYPINVLPVEGINMEFSGIMSPLSSDARSTWAQTTVEYLTDKVGAAVGEESSDYRVSLSMGSLGTQQVVDHAGSGTRRLLLVFAVAISIQSSLQLTREDAERMVLEAFDSDMERFEYIQALQATGDSSFDPALDVMVSIPDDSTTTTSTTTSSTTTSTTTTTTTTTEPPPETTTTTTSTTTTTTTTTTEEPPTVAPTTTTTTTEPTNPPTQDDEDDVGTEDPPPTTTPTTSSPVDEPTNTPTSSSPVQDDSITTTTEAPEDTSSSPPPPPLKHFSAEGLVMMLSPMEPLTLVATSIWREKTASFIQADMEEQFSRDDGDDGSSSSVSVMPGSVQVSIDIDSLEPPLKRNQKRRLRLGEQRPRHLQQTQGQSQEPTLNVTFSTVVSLRSDSDDTQHNVYSYILTAFDSPEKQSAYIELLKEADYQLFEQLETIAVVQASSDNIGSSESSTPPPQGAKIGIIVGVVAVGVALVAIGAFLVYRKRRRSKQQAFKSSSSLSPRASPDKETAIMSSYDHGDHQIHCGDEIEVGSRAEVSTLGDPIPPGMRVGDFIEGGTIFTAANDSLTTDYDFQKAFRSNAFSVDTMTEGSEAPSSTNLLTRDDTTLDAEYLRTGNQFHVEAPSGLLGLVIDTSEEGFPTIRAIKETSCLAGEVQVGDVLLSVDNEDVTPMMASTVSRLIASKKDNPVRDLVFCRLEEEA